MPELEEQPVITEEQGQDLLLTNPGYFESNFLFTEQIGKGGFGQVYKALDIKRKDFFAIKKTTLQGINLI